MVKKLSLLLLLCCLLSISAFTSIRAAAADIVDSGTFGVEDNLSWTLDSDGLLVIRGWGDMGDSYYAPWFSKSHADEVLNVVIEDGVTSIAGHAFRSCTHLVTVSVPKVTKLIRRPKMGLFRTFFKNPSQSQCCYIFRPKLKSGLFTGFRGSGR